MKRLFVIVAAVAVSVVARPSSGLDAPQATVRNLTSYFVHLNEVQNDTKFTLGWPRLSIANGIDLGLIGYARWDTSNTTGALVSKFSRAPKEPAFQVADLSLTFDFVTMWPKSEELFGGATTFQVGKFLFPMFGVGDLVRLNDVLVPHSFTHS